MSSLKVETPQGTVKFYDDFHCDRSLFTISLEDVDIHADRHGYSPSRQKLYRTRTGEMFRPPDDGSAATLVFGEALTGTPRKKSPGGSIGVYWTGVGCLLRHFLERLMVFWLKGAQRGVSEKRFEMPSPL